VPQRILTARDERDIRPLRGERPRDRQPDPATPAGDHGAPPRQLEIHGGHTTLEA
jgi:hypothetical protein